MEQAPSIDALVAEPIGKWVIAGASSVVWCAAPALCGAACWGRPSPDDVGQLLAAFAGFRHARFAPRFDAVLDCRRLEGIDPAALDVLVRWLAAHRDELQRRVRLQLGVIPTGLVGLAMTGILPTLGSTHAFEVTHDAAAAFARVGGAALHGEIEAIVDAASGAPAWLVSLRGALRARPAGVTLDDAARAIGLSRRTLQRLLAQHATTFQDELARARFDHARAALTTSRAKIAAIARDVGLSERGLAQLVKRFAGCTPAELRAR